MPPSFSSCISSVRVVGILFWSLNPKVAVWGTWSIVQGIGVIVVFVVIAVVVLVFDLVAAFMHPNVA